MSKIAILGAAESGVGAAVLALNKGYDVFVSDMGMIKEHYKEILNTYGIEWEEGRHSADKILDAEEIIKSPGIPDNAPMVAEAISKGIHIRFFQFPSQSRIPFTASILRSFGKKRM